MRPPERCHISQLIHAALREDQADADVTSRSLLPSTLRIRAQILAKAPGVLAGGPFAVQIFKAVDPAIRCQLLRKEGQAIRPGQMLARMSGRAISIFAAERTALNLLGHLSGVATLTHAFVRAARPYPAKILDTRKTLPGLRALEKYAVAIAGGQNHRMDLADAILIKTNHLRAYSRQHTADSTQYAGEEGRLIETLIRRAQQIRPKRFVEIEVANWQQFRAALAAKPDAILLDNWSIARIRKAAALRNASPATSHLSPILEVSGGVTLSNIRAIATTGVDRISIGRLTHSAPSLDVSLEVVE